VVGIAIYIVFRPEGHSSVVADAAPSQKPVVASQPTQAERKAIDALLGLTSSTASGAPDAVIEMTGTASYPDGVLAEWTVEGAHTVWLGTSPDGQPTVVRLQQTPDEDNSQVSGSPSADNEKPLTDHEALEFARAAASTAFPDFKGYVRPVTRSEVTAPGDGGTPAWAFTWQYSDTIADEREVSLPKWATIWVDKSTGEIAGYDSLDMSAGFSRELKPDLTAEEAAQQAIMKSDWVNLGLKSDRCTTTLLLVPVRDENKWGLPEMLWKVVPPDGNEAKYVADGSGELLEKSRLYLPALTPGWEEPPFDTAQ